MPITGKTDVLYSKVLSYDAKNCSVVPPSALGVCYANT